jgi:hypothetical protein
MESKLVKKLSKPLDFVWPKNTLIQNCSVANLKFSKIQLSITFELKAQTT